METLIDVTERKLNIMAIGDSIRVKDPEYTFLKEVVRVHHGYIYIFQLFDKLHTQFIPITPEDIPDMREYLK